MSDAVKQGHVKHPWPNSAVNHRIDGALHPQPTPSTAQPTQLHSKVLQTQAPMFSGTGKGGKKSKKSKAPKMSKMDSDGDYD